MTDKPSNLTEHNAAIAEALDALTDAALDYHEAVCNANACEDFAGSSFDDLADAADDYGAAVEARGEWRAKVQAESRDERGFQHILDRLAET